MGAQNNPIRTNYIKAGIDKKRNFHHMEHEVVSDINNKLFSWNGRSMFG